MTDQSIILSIINTQSYANRNILSIGCNCILFNMSLDDKQIYALNNFEDFYLIFLSYDELTQSFYRFSYLTFRMSKLFN